MRVAVVSPFVDRRHGTERAIAELLERLASDYGCEIHLYAQRVEDLRVRDPKSARPARSTKSGAIFWHKVPGIPGPHVAQFLAWMFLNSFLRWWHTRVGGVSYDLVLSPGINCLHPDVVIVHALFYRLKELTRKENEDSTARGSFIRRLHRRVYYGLLTALERRIYTDRGVTLAAVSKRAARLLKAAFQREDVFVIPNGVDSKHFSVAARIAQREEARRMRGFRDEDFILLLIGNDWRNKGLTSILEAMPALLALPVRLLVVGNDNAEPFRARASQLGVQNRCHWESSSPDVLDFYAASDVFVSPSREDSFGLPVAEAMACGLPVITSMFAGVADYLHDAVDGFVLQDPFDARSLSELIQLLYSDIDIRTRMGSAAARTALEWKWDRNSEAVWGILKDLSAHRKAAKV